MSRLHQVIFQLCYWWPLAQSASPTNRDSRLRLVALQCEISLLPLNHSLSEHGLLIRKLIPVSSPAVGVALATAESGLESEALSAFILLSAGIETKGEDTAHSQ